MHCLNVLGTHAVEGCLRHGQRGRQWRRRHPGRVDLELGPLGTLRISVVESRLRVLTLHRVLSGCHLLRYREIPGILNAW